MARLKRMEVRMSAAMRAAVRREADREGLDMAAWVRRVIALRLDVERKRRERAGERVPPMLYGDGPHA